MCERLQRPWRELGEGGVKYLVITVLDDGQVEELAAVFLGQDGVHTGRVGAHKLLVGTEVMRWPSPGHRKRGEEQSHFLSKHAKFKNMLLIDNEVLEHLLRFSPLSCN